MVMEMSKTYQYRKVMKPLLERKRRARINKCLDDLKDLMVECLQQEGEHVTRLEKADILELTVEHMRKLKQRGGLSLQSTPANAHIESFRSGYVHAADQITQVLLAQRQTDELGGKIIKFLSARLIEMQHQLLRTSPTTPLVHPPIGAVGSTGSPSTASLLPLPFPSASGTSDFSSAASSMSPTGMGSTVATAMGGGESSLALSADSGSYAHFALHNYNKAFNNGKDGICNSNGDLIDVTTVDSNSMENDTASVMSMDSSTSSEAVWRPW